MVRRRMLAGLLAGGMLMVPGAVAAGPACTITGTQGNDVFDDGPYGHKEVICGRGRQRPCHRARGEPSFGAVLDLTA